MGLSFIRGGIRGVWGTKAMPFAGQTYALMLARMVCLDEKALFEEAIGGFSKFALLFYLFFSSHF